MIRENLDIANRIIDSQRCDAIRIDAPSETQNLTEWFSKQSQKFSALQLKWFLAHADDGVIWGYIDDAGNLQTSDCLNKNYLPPVRHETWRMGRLFSSKGELFLWRDADNELRARVLYEPDNSISLTDYEAIPSFEECFDEECLLLGTEIESTFNGFTLWREGSRGMRHAIPCCGENKSSPPSLQVRHYLANGEHAARIACGRLLKLHAPEGGSVNESY